MFLACESRDTKNQLQQTNSNQTSIELKSKINKKSIKNSIGLVVVTEKYKFGDVIDIYDLKNNKVTKIVKNDEYQIIALNCIEKNNDYYVIELENGTKGKIKTDLKFIQLQSWEEHILSVFSVEFDNQTNPLLLNPKDNSSKQLYNSDELYFPVKIKENWLQVKYGEERNYKYGWIKWKENDYLLIDFFYFA